MAKLGKRSPLSFIGRGEQGRKGPGVGQWDEGCREGTGEQRMTLGPAQSPEGLLQFKADQSSGSWRKPNQSRLSKILLRWIRGNGSSVNHRRGRGWECGGCVCSWSHGDGQTRALCESQLSHLERGRSLEQGGKGGAFRPGWQGPVKNQPGWGVSGLPPSQTSPVRAQRGFSSGG